MYYIKPVIVLERFGIVTHSYTVYFSIKTHLDNTENILVFTKDDLLKYINFSWKQIENKGVITLDFLLNYAYVSIYFQTKTFAWKRYSAVTS